MFASLVICYHMQDRVTEDFTSSRLGIRANKYGWLYLVNQTICYKWPDSDSKGKESLCKLVKAQFMSPMFYCRWLSNK